jgi:hypothetical protein
MAISVKLHEITNAGAKQRDIAGRACAALETALNHPDFKSRVESATYEETRWWDARGNSRSIPKAEIYGYVAYGLERDTPADQEIDIKVKLARMNSVGSTIPGKLPFRTAYWFINECIETDDVASLAGHFFHEWLHVAGFHHYPDNSARNDVPYVLGQIVIDLLGHREGLTASLTVAKDVAEAPYHGNETELPDDGRDESLML